MSNPRKHKHAKKSHDRETGGNNNSTNLVLGLIIVIIGIFLLLKTLGIVYFSFWDFIATAWPVLLIIVGVSMLIRNRVIAVLFVLGLILISGAFMFSFARETLPRYADEKEYEQSLPFDLLAQEMDVSIEYGSGKLSVERSKLISSSLENNIRTTSSEEPEFNTKKEGSNIYVEMKKKSEVFFFDAGDNRWDISINPKFRSVNIEMDYGAAEADIDLRGLNVDSLDIASGVTSTKIIFPEHATKANIDTGMSSFELEFPDSMGVVISMYGGFISKDLNNFRKEKNKYYSENYDEDKENIEVNISAGFSSFDADFYSG